MSRALVIRLLVLLLALAAPAVVRADPPWMQFFKRKPVEADSRKSYELSERNGPWMILCTSFSGENAAAEAQQLVLELRKKHNLEAFAYHQEYDFTQPEAGLGVDMYGRPRMMRAQNGQRFEQIAVLVGNYDSVEDEKAAETLKMLKYLRPDSMSRAPDQDAPPAINTQVIGWMREQYRKYNADRSKAAKGPLGNAFVTRNPLLPADYFVAKGLDPFVVDLNQDLPYSLLKNPKKYTVRVASFRGVDTFKPAEFERLTTSGGESKIDQAARKANQLCAALRKKGVEAYEFHDRTESIVTIGSFDSVGTERADGKIEINPAVHRLIQDYSAQQVPLPGSGQMGLSPRTEAGIPFDAQPLPVEVPRQSLAAAYNRGLTSR